MKTHGGKRKGAGRKSGPLSKTITFRIPICYYEIVKSKYERGLNKLFIQWVKKIADE